VALPSDSGDPLHLDPIVEATDPQDLLLLAEGSGNRDQLRLARQQHGGETHDSVLFRIALLCERDVDGGHNVPAIGLTHPLGDGRGVCAQFGHHGLALSNRIVGLSNG
jgi:hypothetical protein